MAPRTPDGTLPAREGSEGSHCRARPNWLVELQPGQNIHQVCPYPEQALQIPRPEENWSSVGQKIDHQTERNPVGNVGTLQPRPPQNNDSPEGAAARKYS